MDFIGRWKLHSIGVLDDEKGFCYMTPEEYCSSPIPDYIDENDAEAVESEIRERRSVALMVADVCEDGSVYFLVPFPENATKEEIDEAIANEEIAVRDGMIQGNAMRWELRDGELWYDTGIEGEVLGEKTDGFAKALDEDGFFTFINMRFIKE